MSNALSFSQASLYLATHARTQTPFGATEFLDYHSTRERSSFDKRLKIATECMSIYRQAFAEEYRRSGSPYFSIQREHELYRLIDSKLFPLLWGDLDWRAVMEQHADFFFPAIPVRGLQRYLWEPGGVDLTEVGPAFLLALAMRQFPGAWEMLAQQYDLTNCPLPAPPLGAVGWTLLVYSCAVEGTPVRWLPGVFEMTSYKTGNPWLDLPPIGTAGMQWSLEEVMKLHIMKSAAADMSIAVTALAGYLVEDPKARIKRAVEIWNDAARKEQQSGFQGLCIDEDTGEWHNHEHE